MSNAQESVNVMQNQALEAVRSGQSAAIEALQAWSEAVANLAPKFPAVEVPGAQDALGDPAAIVDSVYDFAGQLIDLNKQFVHSLLEVSQKATKVADDK